MMKTRTEFITVRDIYPFSFSCQHHCCWIVNGGLVSRYWRILPMGSLLMRALSHCYSLSCTHLYQKGAPFFPGDVLGPVLHRCWTRRKNMVRLKNNGMSIERCTRRPLCETHAEHGPRLLEMSSELMDTHMDRC